MTFPADLAARLGTGWTVPLQDTLGEMQLEILLREGGASNSKAAAAGWGGDRVALLEGPGGAAGVVLDTAWDTDADADEFQAALDPLVAKLKASGRSAAVLVPAPDRVVLVTGSSPTCWGASRTSSAWRSRRADARRRRYIDSGAEIPSRASALASVVLAASASARRFAERSGSAASTTRASR